MLDSTVISSDGPVTSHPLTKASPLNDVYCLVDSTALADLSSGCCTEVSVRHVPVPCLVETDEIAVRPTSYICFSNQLGKVKYWLLITDNHRTGNVIDISDRLNQYQLFR